MVVSCGRKFIVRHSSPVTYTAMHRHDPDPAAKSSYGRTRRPGMLSCSTCGRPFHIDETPTPPFCSERCQLIDLGRWLDEEIGVPHEGGNSDQQQTRGQDQDEEDDPT